MNLLISTRKLLALAVGSTVMAALPLGAVAQSAADYPNKPIELVVPFGAGGGTDVLARTLLELSQ